MKYVIDIPNYRPYTLNQLLRVHWAKRNRMKAEDRAVIGAYARSAGVPAADGKRRVRLQITLTSRMKQTDHDNAWKSLLDALVQTKLLIDDSPDWVETLPVSYVRGLNKATRIELEEVCG